MRNWQEHNNTFVTDSTILKQNMTMREEINQVNCKNETNDDENLIPVCAHTVQEYH